MNRYFSVFIVFGLLFVLSNTASADFVDFSSSDFAAANGATSFEATAAGVDMTITPAPIGSKIYWDSTDGLGVDSLYWLDEQDEIDNCESLTIVFDNSVSLASVSLTDLFYENGYLEMGYYILDDGTIEKFSADMSQVSGTNGELTVDIGADKITAITFKAFPSFFYKDHDYSVKGIDITPNGSGSGNTGVPELNAESSVSALALLFGCVLVSNGRRKLRL